jgi:hypothetical protein
VHFEERHLWHLNSVPLVGSRPLSLMTRSRFAAIQSDRRDSLASSRAVFRCSVSSFVASAVEGRVMRSARESNPSKIFIRISCTHITPRAERGGSHLVFLEVEDQLPSPGLVVLAVTREGVAVVDGQLDASRDAHEHLSLVSVGLIWSECRA